MEKRSIAAVRNGGARAAVGDILAFVDADSQIHPETFNAIERTMASGRVVIGATGFLYDRMFERYGDWHYVTNAFGAFRWLLTGRGSFTRFIQRYWYEERQ